MKLFFILLFSVSLSFAQSSKVLVSSNDGNSIPQRNASQSTATQNTYEDVDLGKYSDFESPKGAVGFAYVNKNYLPIKISGLNIEGVTARYNAFNGEMEILKEGDDKPIALDRYSEYKVTFSDINKTYVPYDYEDVSGNVSRDFMVALNLKEKVSLLKREKKRFLRKELAPDRFAADKPAQFIKEKDKYYITKPGDKGLLILLPAKKQLIAALYPEREKEILTFMKKNSIKIRKEADLIKLVDFLNK